MSIDLVDLSAPYEFCLHASNGALRSAIEQGRVTQEDLDAWLEGLASTQAAGYFFQSWPLTIVSGVVAYGDS